VGEGGGGGGGGSGERKKSNRSAFPFQTKIKGGNNGCLDMKLTWSLALDTVVGKKTEKGKGK